MLDDGRAYCGECRNVVPDAKFCAECGEELRPPPKREPQKCPDKECGTLTSGRYCPTCGVQVHDELFDRAESGEVTYRELAGAAEEGWLRWAAEQEEKARGAADL